MEALKKGVQRTPENKEQPQTPFVSASEHLKKKFEEKAKASSERQKRILHKRTSECKKCFGRGYIGKDVKTGKLIPCKCVL